MSAVESVANAIFEKIKRATSTAKTMQEIETIGNKLLQDGCKKQNCFVLYPLVVCPDNIVNHAVLGGNRTAKKSDLVKADLAIADNDTKEHCYIGRRIEGGSTAVHFLDKLEESIKRRIKAKTFKTTKHLVGYIEDKCIDYDIIENCKSFKYQDNTLFSEEYFVCNYKSDEIVKNDSLKLVPGDLYTIDISITEKGDEPASMSYSTLAPKLGFFNNKVYDKKMKMSKSFYKAAKTEHGNNVFFIDDKDKGSLDDCAENDLFEYLYPVVSTKPVYTIRFSVKIE